MMLPPDDPITPGLYILGGIALVLACVLIVALVYAGRKDSAKQRERRCASCAQPLRTVAAVQLCDVCRARQAQR